MTERTKKDAPKRVSSDIIVLIAKKMLFFQDIIQKTILHVQRNKMLDIVGISEVNNCINTLFILSKKILICLTQNKYVRSKFFNWAFLSLCTFF